MKNLKELVLSFEHPNKEFEKKFKELWLKWFEEEDRIIEEYDKMYPDYHGLDGPKTSALREARRELFRKIKELKKEYGIDE